MYTLIQKYPFKSEKRSHSKCIGLYHEKGWETHSLHFVLWSTKEVGQSCSGTRFNRLIAWFVRMTTKSCDIRLISLTLAISLSLYQYSSLSLSLSVYYSTCLSAGLPVCRFVASVHCGSFLYWFTPPPPVRAGRPPGPHVALPHGLHPRHRGSLLGPGHQDRDPCQSRRKVLHQTGPQHGPGGGQKAG